MCYIEYFAIIPKGCIATNKHAHVARKTIPCFENIAVSMVRNAAMGLDPEKLELIFCKENECMKIDCFRRRLEVKALQGKNMIPYCPVCKGEKTRTQALMVNEEDTTAYAILPNGLTLRNAPDPGTALPRFISQRKYFLGTETKSETPRIKTKVMDKMPYKKEDHGIAKRMMRELESGKRRLHARWPVESPLYDLDPAEKDPGLEVGIDWYYPDWLDG